MNRRGWLLGACASVVSPALQAGGVQLQPVTVSLRAGDTHASVWVRNPGDEPLSIRMRSFAWTQPGGEDDLQDTTELAVSPARATLPAGARQRLRVVLLSVPADAQERSYRLIVDELKGAPEAVAARYSLPVFANVDEGAPVQLLASVAALDGTRTRLRIENPGRRHARLVDLAWRPAEGEVRVLAADLAGYVLPGSHKLWTLAGPVDAFRAGRFEASVDGRVVSLPVA